MDVRADAHGTPALDAPWDPPCHVPLSSRSTVVTSSARTDDEGGAIDPAIRRPNVVRTNRTMQQRRAESALAQHPYQVELRGTLNTLTWPAVCAACGSTATGRVRVPKPFGRPRYYGPRSNGIRTTIIVAADVPFCDACTARHEALVHRPTLASQVFRSLLTPILIPMVGSAIVGYIVLRASLDMSPGDPGAWIPWSVMGALALTFVLSIAGAWRASRAHRIEKQTEVTLACDFSDDVSGVFDAERRIYAIRDRAFAESFASLNRDRLWTEEDDRRASRQSMIVFGVVVAVGAVIWGFVVLGS